LRRRRDAFVAGATLIRRDAFVAGATLICRDAFVAGATLIRRDAFVAGATLIRGTAAGSNHGRRGNQIEFLRQAMHLWREQLSFVALGRDPTTEDVDKKTKFVFDNKNVN